MRKVYLLVFLLLSFFATKAQTYNITACSGTALNFSDVSTYPTSTYTWTAPTGSFFTGGSAQGAAQASLNQTLVNTTNIPTVVTYTVTESVGSTVLTVNITLYPAPSVNGITDQVKCNGVLTTAINFTGAVAGTDYNWTNSTTSIGAAIPGSGTGNIAAFATTNPSNVPVTAIFVVTPVSNACSGPTISFSITVNPTPSVNQVPDQVICNATITTAVNFTGSVTSTAFNWTNTTPSINLTTPGTGNIAAFTTTNATSAAVTGIVTVTPVSNTCSGTPISFSYMVNPTPQVNQPVDVSICKGTFSPGVTFTGSMTSTTFNWTNNSSGTGVAFPSGTGNIPGFTSTNAGNTPISALITVTPLSNTCTGTPLSFSITVNPTPFVNAIADQVVCNGLLTTLISFTGAVPNTVFNYVSGTPSIGLASGAGAISSFTGTNATGIPVTDVVTVTPFSNACNGAPISFSITVNPTPTVNQPTDQVICSATQNTAVTFTSGVANTTFNWTNSASGTGLPFPSSSGNIGAFTLTNGSNIPLTALIQITPVSNSCSGIPLSFSITINPTPTVNTVPSQVVCNGTATTAINFTGFVGASTVFNWVNSTPSINLASPGAGNIGVFTATNITGVPVTAFITVTPVSNACTGATTSFSILVNPTPDVNQPTDQVLCNGTQTTGVTFASTIGGTTFNWTNNTSGIGLGFPSGAGNINPFTAVNGSGTTVTALVTVTPVSNTCSGTPVSFSYSINPTPTVSAVPSQVVCNGTATTAVNFVGTAANTIFNWTNSTPSINLSTPGAGNIAVFTATNATGSPVTALITVTPVSNTCTGSTTSFSILVNPTPDVNQPTDQVVCNGTATTGVIFSSSAPGTIFNWTNNTSGIGLSFPSGGGNISTFTAINGSVVPVVAIVTVTPVSNTCSGTALSFSYTINPTPVVNAVAAQTLCNGILTSAVNFTGSVASAVYNWTNSTPSIGLASPGNGNIAAFTVTNATNAAVTALVTVTPVSNTCSGITSVFTIVVNPTPDIAQPSDVVICNNVLLPAINFTGSVTSTGFNWTNSSSLIGLGFPSGAGNIAAFTVTNSSSAPITAVVVVSPVSNTCLGTPLSFSITVNPTPTLNAIPDQLICNAFLTNAVTFTGPVANTTFNWTNTAPIIGLASPGAGNIAAFTATNISSAPITALIAVTPVSNSCNGAVTSFSITVSPTPTVNAVADQVHCNGVLTSAINFTGLVAGTTFNWTNTTPAINLTSPGVGNIAAFTATNLGNSPVSGLITVTPVSNTCTGTPTSFSILVNPTPTVNAVADQVLCNGFSTTTVTFSGSVASTVFNWTNTIPVIGLSSPGAGNIAAFTATTGGGNVPVNALITITPFSNACNGASTAFSITVNPTPTVVALADQSLCNGFTTTIITLTGIVPNTVFNWTNTAPGINLAASGAGSIASFTATNAGNVPVTAFINVTPFSNSCTGTATTFSITVNPTPTIAGLTDQVLCNGFTTTTVTFSGLVTSTTFNWTNSAASVGIGLTGTGNITSFAATNVSAVPVNALITVTPFSNACTGASGAFSITVNPTPTVNGIASQSLCNGFSTTTVNFTGAVANTTFNWTNNIISSGLAASGAGTIAAFTVVNGTNTTVSSLVTVTPFSNACFGTPITFSITANPTPTVVGVTDQVVCNGVSTTSVVFTGAVASTIFNWTNSVPSIGLASPGSGTIGAFAAINASGVPVNALINVTPFSNACIGAPTAFSITVNPSPTVAGITDVVRCNGFSITAISFTSVVPSTVFTWTNSAPSIGLAASGSGTIPAFTTTNATGLPVIAVINITPFSNTCTGATTTFSITVNPTPTVGALSDVVICAGFSTTGVTFSGAVGNTVFNWTNSVTAIGLAASGSTTTISPFITVNGGSIPLNSVVTVTPFSNACTGTSTAYSITVNPIPTVAGITDVVRCNGFSMTAVTFTSVVPSTVFSWTNTAPSIGVAATGLGTIPAFTATNGSALPVVGLITITPFSNTCTGASTTFSVTVNPTPTVGALSDVVLCAGFSTTAVTFTGAVGSTIFNWTNSVTAIGLAAAGSTTTISPFITVNGGSIPLNSVVTVTPFSNACTGSSTAYSITVNPIPTVAGITDVVRCNGFSVTAVTFTSVVPSTVFSWTNTAPSIGVAATGLGTIPAFTATNGSGLPVVGLITITPFSNTCTGTSTTFSVTVNPTPTVGALSDVVLCAGFSTTSVTFTGAVGSTVFNWTNSITAIGLAAAGSTTTIGSFITVNGGGLPVHSVVTITPFSNACIGASTAYSITVNPIPTVAGITDITRCNGLTVTTINFTSVVPSTTFSWTNTIASIGVAATGTGSIPGFTATNAGTLPVSSVVLITPISNTCTGTSTTFSITVYPTPTVVGLTDQALCNTFSTVTVSFTGGVPGTIYSWTNTLSSIGLATSGTGNIVAFTTTNATGIPVSSIVSITPFSNSCAGASTTFSYTVYPTPTVVGITDITRCNGFATNAINFTGAVPSTTYNWTNSITTIGLAPATSSGNIAAFTTTNATPAPVSTVLVVTPFSNTCTGASTTFSITVYPTPTVNAITAQAVCNATSITTITITGFVPNTVFSWTRTNVSGSAIGLAATGTGNINGFTASNLTPLPVSTLVTVTPLSNACTGATTTFTLTVYPTPTINTIATQVLCNGFTTTAANFTSFVPNTTFTWTNSNTSIGLAATNTGNIAAFLATNATALPISATINITTFSNTCFGTPTAFSITVNPTPTFTSTLTATICNATTFSYTGTTLTPGTSFLWNRAPVTNVTGNGSSSASGSNQFINELLNNSTTGTANAVYAFTLTANACTNQQNVTVTINPSAALISGLTPTSICDGTTFSYVATSSTAPATFAWSRPTITGITTGGAASGTGNISQTLVNTTASPIPVPYYYIVSTNGCANTNTYTVTVTVNPTPVLSSSLTPAALCSFSPFAYVGTSATLGTVFNWTRATATGIIASGPATSTVNTILNTLNNTNASLSTINYDYQLVANGCFNNQTVVASVYPAPYLSSTLTPQPVCSGTIFSYSPTNPTAGTTFNWSRAAVLGINNPASSGTFDPSETLVNGTPLPVNVIYNYTLISAAGCANSQTITVNINPSPVLTTSLTPPGVCSGAVFSYNPTSATPGTTFSWFRAQALPVTNPTSTGVNNPNETLVNPTITPAAVTYNFTLTANACNNIQNVTVLVNPIPVVTAQTTATCSNIAFSVSAPSVPSATIYTWTAPTIVPFGSTIGGSAQSVGQPSVSQLLNNQTINASTATYTVIPAASGCSGSTFTVTVTINPVPFVADQLLAAICSGNAFSYAASTNIPAGTKYTWTNPALVPAGGLTGGSQQSTSQTTVSQVLNSVNNLLDTAIYTVTPATALCIGNAFTITVPVKPVPLIANMKDTTCSGVLSVSIPSPAPVNTTYTWGAPAITPGGSVTGSTSQGLAVPSISQTLTNNSTSLAQVIYTVTPTANSCQGPTFTLTKSVYRFVPSFGNLTTQTCSGSPFNTTPANAPTGTTYTWPAPVANPSVGITGASAATTAQTIVSQTLVNKLNIVDTVTYTVTPSINNCTGPVFSAIVRVMPLPQGLITGKSTICQNPLPDTVTVNFTGTAPWNFTYTDGNTTATRTGITTASYTLVLPIYPKTATTRTVRIYDVKDATCFNTIDTTSFVQTINPLPVGQIVSLHGTYLCNGLTDTLLVKSRDSVGYQWKYNNAVIPGATTDSISTPTAGRYNALLTNVYGCSDTAAIPMTLILIKPPVLKFTYDTACINSKMTFTNKTDTTFTGTLQWLWTFGNGSTDTAMNPNTRYTSAGNYHITLKATQLYCSNYAPVKLDSTINIKFPIPGITLPSVSAYKGQLTPVAGRSMPNYSYLWTPATGIQNPDSISTNFNYSATQLYGIKLISPEGCVTTDTMLVRVFDDNTQQIFVPKSFTPNGDGINDILYPYVAGVTQFHFFRILNRYGKLLFETKTTDKGWDGTINGVPQPMSIYFWVAEGVAVDGTVIQKSGQILLIR